MDTKNSRRGEALIKALQQETEEAMSENTIVTNDEIMEMTQLVFDRYYSELKRQLRRSGLPEDMVEQHCTTILSKVYQEIEAQGVVATSYEIDACAIPIINEEIRKILVPMHLNEYRNLRENPLTERQESVEAEHAKAEHVEAEEVETEHVEAEKVEAESVVTEEREATKEEALPSQMESTIVVPDGKNEISPVLQQEIRRILQQELQLESTQVKPIVVVVNLNASKEEGSVVSEESSKEKESTVENAEPINPGDVIEITRDYPAETDSDEIESDFAVRETAATSEDDTLPQLDFDIERMIMEAEEAQGTKKKKRSWLWILIVFLLMLLLWLTIGMLMSYDIIPKLDLGYEWFNEALYELF